MFMAMNKKYPMLSLVSYSL